MTKFKVGDLAAVGCMVDSDGTCPECKAGLEQYCPNFTLTYNFPTSTWAALPTAATPTASSSRSTLCCAFRRIWTWRGGATALRGHHHVFALRHWGVTKGKKVGVVGLGGLGHMGVKFAHALGAHVVVFTTSPGKKDDALRLGADEVVLSKDSNEMAKHAGSFDFILDAVAAQHDINAYISMLARDGNITMVGAPDKPLPVGVFGLILPPQFLRFGHRRHCGDAGDAGLLLAAQHCLRRRSDSDPEDQRSLRAAAEVGREVPVLD